MMRRMCILIAIATLTTGTVMADDDDKEKERNLDPVYYLALDGNVSAAMEKLNSMDPRSLSAAALRTRSKYAERFGKNAHPEHRRGTGLVYEILGVFESYWNLVLLQKTNATEGYRYLFERLAPISKRLGSNPGRYSEDELERIAKFLTGKLRENGYYAIIGDVKPHLNFMAWKAESKRPYKVELGDGQIENVAVVFMHDFVSLGWAAYATFGKMHVGGWVEDHALYCVTSKYDLNSENFKISFLSHEARHFSDKRKYKDLSSTDLEYRAKLTEISLSDNTFAELLRKFVLEQKDNPSNPHSFASFRLIRDLSDRLGKKIDVAFLPELKKTQIRAYARDLLNKDTRRLDMAAFQNQHP